MIPTQIIIKYVLILVAVVSGYYALATYHYNKGCEDTIVEISLNAHEEIAKATEAALNSAEIEIAKALERQRVLFDAELKRVEEDRIVEVKIEEVINEVEKIKYVDNCGKLNPDSIRLLNNSINYVNSTSATQH